MTQKHEFVYLSADSLILHLADISMAQNTQVCNFCFGIDNYLYIEGLWSIKDTAPKDNLCTGCQVIDDETFVFTTFGGGRFVMKINDGVIELASKMLIK